MHESLLLFPKSQEVLMNTKANSTLKISFTKNNLKDIKEQSLRKNLVHSTSAKPSLIMDDFEEETPRMNIGMIKTPGLLSQDIGGNESHNNELFSGSCSDVPDDN